MPKRKHRRMIHEHLTPHWGFFYSVRKRLYKGRTKYQKIEMVDTPEFGRMLRLDRITQVVEKNEYQYHEPMVHPAMCCHPRPRDILVVGGGDGGILREVVRYRSVRHIDIAEIDEKVIEFSRKYLSRMNRRSFEDRRVTVNVTDGRDFVRQTKGAYDIIIMDMTDPFGPSKYLYTKEFFRLVKSSLKNKDGIFVMHADSPVWRPATFNAIVKTLSSVFPQVQPLYVYIQMYAALWSIGLSSSSKAVSTTTASLVNRRLRRNGIRGLKVFTGETFDAMRVAYPYVREILNKRSRILTDRRPDAPEPVVR
ncbi:MAG: polyamine aminopropyltransferase [Chitinivibrionales bacterium]|nr:polyamine aminopropyltransferase [Chitinivibrionales bacterium]MBD3395191.1 polyamine aminopropyltransferase [Chitinivibrionales bacterium]